MPGEEMAALVSNPPAGPYLLRAELKVESQNGEVIAATTARGKPGPNFLSLFPKSLRMTVD